MNDRPLCRCHNEPMYPNNSVGGWRCRVKVKARQTPKQRDYYARRGWLMKRKWDLAQQRTKILEELAQLHQEGCHSDA